VPPPHLNALMLACRLTFVDQFVTISAQSSELRVQKDTPPFFYLINYQKRRVRCLYKPFRILSFGKKAINLLYSSTK